MYIHTQTHTDIHTQYFCMTDRPNAEGKTVLILTDGDCDPSEEGGNPFQEFLVCSLSLSCFFFCTLLFRFFFCSLLFSYFLFS